MPEGVTNEPAWVGTCCKIRARAIDLLSGRLDIFVAALDLRKLATWGRFDSDPDLQQFELMLAEIGALPIGPERAHWSAAALAREDQKIAAIRERWNFRAMEAARNLAARYEWAIARRAELARLGVHGPESKKD